MRTVNKELQTQAEQLNRKHRLRQRWYKILSVPACIVVFITTYAMILPAITLESTPDTYCGKVEHVHTDACYEIPGTPERTELGCSAQELLARSGADYIIHTHDSFCFDSRGELRCSLAETQEHQHDDSCYDADGNLTCTMGTGVIHQHSTECVVTIPAVAPQGLLCEQEEHVHTVDCMTAPEGTNVPDTTGLPVSQTAQENGVSTQAAVDISGITVSIADTVETNGCYQVTLTGKNASSLDDDDVYIKWEMSTDNGTTWTTVQRQRYISGGNVLFSIAENGLRLYPGLVPNGGMTEDHNVIFRATICNKVSDTQVVEGRSAQITNNKYSTQVLNGSFETPDFKDKDSYQYFVKEGTPGLFWKTTANNEQGDQSVYYVDESGNVNTGTRTGTNDGLHYIEVVDTSTDDHKAAAGKYHNQDTPSDGTQYAEINAGASGALYQSVLTVPGGTMNWMVDHNGRAGTDTMAVVIMAEKDAKNITTQTQLRQAIRDIQRGRYPGAEVVSDLTAASGNGKAAWTTHGGTYYVPDGQYYTRFFFVAIDTAATGSEKNTIGNHIDKVWFSRDLPPLQEDDPKVKLSKTITGDLKVAGRDELKDNLVFTMTLTEGTDANGTVLDTIEIPAETMGDWTDNGDGTWTLSREVNVPDKWVSSTGNTRTITVTERGADTMEDYKWTQVTTPGSNTIWLDTSTGKYNTPEFAFTNDYKRNALVLGINKFVHAPDTSGVFRIKVTYTPFDAADDTTTTTTYLDLTHDGDAGLVTGIKPGSWVTVQEVNSDGYTVTFREKNALDSELLSSTNYYGFTMEANGGFTIHNTATADVPETGGVGTYVFMYGGLLLMAGSVLAGALLRRKYRREEE